jgi:hypothetical protein
MLPATHHGCPLHPYHDKKINQRKRTEYLDFNKTAIKVNKILTVLRVQLAFIAKTLKCAQNLHHHDY